jgi:hypothetical protein
LAVKIQLSRNPGSGGGHGLKMGRSAVEEEEEKKKRKKKRRKKKKKMMMMIGVCTGLFLFRKERKFAYEITTLLVATCVPPLELLTI